MTLVLNNRLNFTITIIRNPNVNSISSRCILPSKRDVQCGGTPLLMKAIVLHFIYISVEPTYMYHGSCRINIGVDSNCKFGKSSESVQCAITGPCLLPTGCQLRDRVISHRDGGTGA